MRHIFFGGIRGTTHRPQILVKRCGAGVVLRHPANIAMAVDRGGLFMDKLTPEIVMCDIA